MDNLNQSRCLPLTHLWVMLNRLLEKAENPTIPCEITNINGVTSVRLQFFSQPTKRHSPAKIRRDARRKRQYLERWNSKSKVEGMSPPSFESDAEISPGRVEEVCTLPATSILKSSEGVADPMTFQTRMEIQEPNPCSEITITPVVHYFFLVRDSIRKEQTISTESGSKEKEMTIQQEMVQEVVRIETVSETIMLESTIIPITHDVSSVPPHLEATQQLYGPEGTGEIRAETLETPAVSPGNPGHSVPNTTQETLESPGIFSTAVGWMRGLIHPPTTGEPFWV